nr:hypothetical protein [Tanacetum cinerariifolium]
DAIGADDAVVVLLAARERLPEAVIAHKPVAAHEGVPNPHAHRARQRLRVKLAPVHLPRLQFHHARDAIERSKQVVGEADAAGRAHAEALRTHAVV